MINNVIVKPSEVWAYFQNHKGELGTQMNLLAEANEGKIGIYLTERDGDPAFVVEDCDEVIDEDITTNPADCEETAEIFYAQYLGYDELDMSADSDIEKEIIEEREDEITVLFQNLLFDLLVDTADEDIINDIVEDVKEHTLEYIARKHNLPIYRPMYLEDEDGVDFFSEYPYEEMIFEDFNPIYEPTD